jgi:hypothetical protein
MAGEGEGEGPLTVDSNSHGLGENEAIGADKGRHLAQRVKLEVVDTDIWRSGLNEFNVEFVLFGDHEVHDGAGVVAEAVQLSERHLDCDRLGLCQSTRKEGKSVRARIFA